MFRLHLDPALPMTALAGQQGDQIRVVLNPYLIQSMPFPERIELVNNLMAELDRQAGTVIDIKDLREKRQISLLVTAVQEQIEQKGSRRGVDTNSRKR